MDQSLFDPNAVDRWHDDGWCVLEGLIPTGEVDAAREALAPYYPAPSKPASSMPSHAGPPADPSISTQSANSREGTFDLSWDAPKPMFPFAEMALNQLVVHPRLIALAEELLGTDQIRLYQGLASAKYSEGPQDYEQLLHVDYGNHTLVVPRTDMGYQHLELFVYLSDVTSETAATRMVSRRLTADIPVERTYLSFTDYAPLYESEVPASGPAGSVLAYRPDVFHRGTSLSAEGSVRYLLHVAYKPVATDWLGYQSWPAAAEGAPWHRFVSEATLRQLTVLGFPEPGHPYWTDETLNGVAARYPRLDMTPWRTIEA
ncbi:MAG TPA: phytanoyl-CoA dioxygenase family protein [Acidimicrobiales bacterium]